MKVEIKNSFTLEVIFSTDVDGETESIRLGLAAKVAINAGVSLQFANLRRADLRQADLQRADLQFANLRRADLRQANLQLANLQFANLRQADLRQANLQQANLQLANLQFANLRRADLRQANLQLANLQFANLRRADLPSPTMVLLASWFQVSLNLTADLMEYDAASHPDRAAFSKWAKGGTCPYTGVKVQRAANFQENREAWGKGKLRGAYSLMLDLFKEKQIKF